MSASDLIKKPLKEIREYLAEYGAELRETKIPDTYLIKFHPETKINHPAVNQLRGLMFNALTGQIYSLTYPVPIEVKDLQLEEQHAIIDTLSKSQYTVEEVLDGTLLRFSYIDEAHGWLLSTNGKEDAHDAFWMNGQSFADQFWSARPIIHFDQLNRDYVYMFLLCHPLNVIVVNHELPRVYHVATYDRNTMKEIDVDLGIEHPKVLSMSVEDVQKKVLETRDKPVASAGYMVIKKPGDDGVVHRYRFENFNYSQARELRGESNNINFTLLGYMLDKDDNHLKEFLQYYPIYRNDVTQLEKRLIALVGKFYREYGIRFKEHGNIFVHPRHHRFLSEIHTQVYLAHLKGMNRTVQFQDIMEFVKNLPTAKVLYLLNYIYDQ